ncbi:hypothetical protein NKR23_g10636 [Pleurostoma richardsiae]|uniref:Uncharacterized protein n=1 Tax=Pleurostoma richardsiae TaxID=41990 RepID=A0AA38R427_9PEZI|nr:hypothetical protein NKR23_g10636 [Pleurostoma richardsiae]
MPYSDNMYSMDASDGEPIDDPLRRQAGAGHADEDVEDDPQALSPSDGYFGRSEGASWSPSQTTHAWHAAHIPTTTSYASAASSQVPHVPDVWVSDPSLEQGSTADSKAREAREEREQNARLNSPQPSASLAYEIIFCGLV